MEDEQMVQVEPIERPEPTRPEPTRPSWQIGRTAFVTGATGVLGRATVPRLVAAGYRVRALLRPGGNAEAIRALGAEPVPGDLFDARSLALAVAGADAVLHLATRIPPTARMRRPAAWVANDRIRAEGTRSLVDAALAGDVETVVYPSFAFVYPDSGDAWVDAATVAPAPTRNLRSTLAAEGEAARFAAAGGGRRGVALRMAGFYGPDAPSAMEQLRLAERGVSIFGGRADAYTPVLWVDDAATAVLAALERAPSGVYDVADDEPLRRAEAVAAFAAAVGRRRLWRLPAPLLRVIGGPPAEALLRSIRLSNRRFKGATGWAPAVRDARAGMARLARPSATIAPTPPAPPALPA